MNLINAKGLRKIYPLNQAAVVALQHIDIQVPAGDMLAIMGASGSGKSTLLHILGCLEKPSQGTYFLNGQDVTLLDDQSLSALRASFIGFIFQSFNLIPHLTVAENVQLPLFYRNEKYAPCKVLQAVERVGLAHRLQHLPTQLSGGEIQRTAIARALIINPLLILADEPTGNLDFETSCSILALFQTLSCQGATIIMVTHDECVAKHCKRIIRMRDGLMLTH